MSGSHDPLLERLRARDAATLTHIVTSHARSVYRAALALGFTDDAAQDLTQDVFTTFLETLDRFEGRSQVRTWLLGILYRKGQERRRLMYREETLDPADPVFESLFTERGLWVQHPQDPTEIFDDEGAMQAIANCLAKLPALHRSVFQLRQVEELSAAEVSEMLGESVNHIGVLLHRARTRLRDCLMKKGRTAR
jgi:RNA polymerase sigma-70 factor (ECF subfamily)